MQTSLMSLVLSLDNEDTESGSRALCSAGASGVSAVLLLLLGSVRVETRCFSWGPALTAFFPPARETGTATVLCQDLPTCAWWIADVHENSVLRVLASYLLPVASRRGAGAPFQRVRGRHTDRHALGWYRRASSACFIPHADTIINYQSCDCWRGRRDSGV